MAADRRRGRGTPEPTALVGSQAMLQAAMRVLALLGLGVATYLAYLHFSDSSAAGCSAGSGCDAVRHSDYSSIAGIPVAVLGMLGFVGILVASFSGLDPFKKRASLYLVALAGVTFSAYLTYLELAVIEAVCPYCVVSALLMTAILVLLLLQRPVVPGITRDPFRLYSGAVVLLVVFGSLVAWSGVDDGGVRRDLSPEEMTYQVALAQHLTDTGAVMYGAYWCPHCSDQKDWFGSAFQYVDYVECDPRGDDANPVLCQQKDVRLYPTWEIGGRRYEGAMALEELAQLSNYSQQ